MIEHDQHGYAVNGPNLYRYIAGQAANSAGAAVLWTDGRGSAVSLLFTVPHEYIPGERVAWCGLHPSVRPERSLVIAARGHGMMAVPIFDYGIESLHADYIKEKLGLGGEEIAELINGVLAAVKQEYV